jgi:hypothetical protein
MLMLVFQYNPIQTNQQTARLGMGGAWDGASAAEGYSNIPFHADYYCGGTD